jgi:hypothetical protein
MKKIVFLLLSVATVSVVSAQGTFRIGGGAHLKVTGGAYVVTDNMNVENNGNLVMSAGDGTLKFTGSTDVNLSGTGTTTLSSLSMFKSISSQVSLQKDVTVNDRVFFSSGNINLGNHTITLQGIGSVNGESETGRVMGDGTGYVQATASLNAPSSQNPGNLGALVTSTTNLGNTIVRRGHASQVNAFGNGTSILRYYDIIPANNSSLDATLRFNYLDAELNGHSENTLTMWRSANNTAWTNLGADTRDASLNFVEKAAVDQFYRFTLAEVSSVLPVRFSSVNAQCLHNGVKLTWTTTMEQGSKSFVVQQSTDGRDWMNAGSVPAAGNSTATKTYSYSVVGAGNTKYRIVEESIDGRRTYSPVMQSNCTATISFNVFPNPVKDYVVVHLTANDEHPVLISVIDVSGRQVAVRTENVLKGNNQFVIATSGWQQGSYLVKVEDRGIARSATIIK